MKLLFLFAIFLLIITTIFAAPFLSGEDEQEECVDKSEYCKHMKHNCFDSKYDQLMKTQCRLTCGFCVVKPDLIFD